MKKKNYNYNYNTQFARPDSSNNWAINKMANCQRYKSFDKHSPPSLSLSYSPSEKCLNFYYTLPGSLSVVINNT